jgi:hypothetical protein
MGGQTDKERFVLVDYFGRSHLVTASRASDGYGVA